MVQPDTILIAVGDGVLADSLRFSLELEGFETRFCDEHALTPDSRAPYASGACLVMDQDVFSRMDDGGASALPDRQGMPTILMVSQKTRRVLARAKAGGVTEVLEKPVLGGLLFETIRQVVERDK